MGSAGSARWRRWLPPALVVIAVGAIYVLALTLPIADWLEGLRQPLLELGWLGVLLFAVGAGLAVCLLVPGILLTVGAGIVFPYGQAVTAAFVSAWGSALLSFALSRSMLRPFVARRLERMPVMQELDRAVERDGWKVIMLVRLCPMMPFPIMNYALGLTKVDWRSHAWATLAAMVPGNLLYTYLGVIGRVSLEALAAEERKLHPAEIALIGLSIVALLLLGWWAGRQARAVLHGRAEREG